MRFAVVAGLITIAAAPATAQTAAISLDALAQDVVTHNPERQFYQRQIETAGVERDAAGRWADPEAVVEFGQRRAQDLTSGAVTGEGLTYAVSVVQPIEFGGRIALRRAIAERQVALARIGLQQFDATLAARARSLGYGLFAADEKAAAAREVAARMRTLARVLVSRDPAGPAPQLEAASLVAGAISAERSAASADAEANSILYELNQLRGAPLAARVRIIRPDMSLPALPSGQALAANAAQNNFELKALRAQFEQQGLRVDLAKKARIPTVSVGPYYDRARSDIRETNYGVRLSTSIPLWNRQAGDVAIEQGKQAQANATLINAERRIIRDVFDQAAQYEAKRDALTKWDGESPKRFAEAAADADRNYRLGAIPLTTYTQMQQSYIDAVNAVLDTRREALEALLQLRALNGGTPLAR
ncbi:cobalt-zinc-cadmium efflux system outer membrane protein [Sphingomonas jinjuensis]|uniref:Cobalt-zinc-cadmium efflux system outer membrane protein n=1 Tax=Sphingomonas jinjuensis TaxID=535907 RepID=A0A840FA32_9SPHN|nr:TolC family protein [Sphingomonas jinjuensis]MBB4154880.1 cobalt-zinc-cadmium efflux system outer membrane protein [Sphingomonas jinjuensis]